MRAERNRLRGYSCNTIRYCIVDHDDIFKALPFTDAEGQSLWKRKIIHALHTKHEMKVDVNFVLEVVRVYVEFEM